MCKYILTSTLWKHAEVHLSLNELMKPNFKQKKCSVSSDLFWYADVILGVPTGGKSLQKKIAKTSSMKFKF